MPVAAPQPAAPQPAAAYPAPSSPQAPLGVVGSGYAKGPVGARLFAWIADGVIAGALLPLVVLLLVAASAREEFSVVGAVLAVVAGLWQLAYSLGRDVFGGAGFGKRLAGIVVVSSETGAQASGGSTVLRQVVLYALNTIPVIGNLIEPALVLVNKEGRRLGDKAAKTQVVRAADLAARGVPLKTGKGAAIGVLVAALLVSIAGSVAGGVVLARSAAGGVEALEGATPLQAPAETPGTEIPATETPGTQAPAESEPQPDSATEDETLKDPRNPETAVDAVGNLLNSLKENDVDAARAHATRNFQEEESWFFVPAGGALIQFEVAKVYEDAGLWVVEVNEEWNSGPQKSRYFIIVEDNTPRVDSVEFLQ
ncbi:MAG: RDD family protein [Coriobacteriia bacterium]|nr:RDD family protein [Coriobacteriia bacterium]